MSWLRSLLLAGLVSASLVSADHVLELTDSDFESGLEQADTALVMFYAPWCGHCKRLKPDFEKAAEKLKYNDPPVTLAKVDCTEGGKDTCGRFEVRGYPTLKIFRGGELSQDYNGPRELDGIVKYMRSQVGPSSVECQSEEDLAKLLSKDEVVVVSYGLDGKEQETFNKVAESLRESTVFGHYAGAKDKKGVFLHRPKHLQSKMEPVEVKFDDKVTKDALKDWIKDNYHGLVAHRTMDNLADFKSPLVVAYYNVDYKKNTKGTNYWRNRVMKVAKSHPKLYYAVSNKDDFLQEASEFGLDAMTADKPQVTIKEGSKKFVMSDEFSIDNFEKFLSDYEAGKVEPHIKSEEVPEKQGNVKVAVAKNFEELVQNSPNDVLIEFYAPWCGHCKKLTPIFEELGEKMADENVDIVKMDATANDVADGFDVRGFPTLFWLPKDTKKPVAYQGGREVDDFVKYIAENASDELKSFDRKGKAKKSEL